MDIATAVLTVVGLVIFETIVSIGNAIINAETLSTMSQKARRWFLTWASPSRSSSFAPCCPG